MKTILRSILLHVILFCSFSLSLSAQAGSVLTLDESSFRLEQTDALGGVNIDPIGKDRSNRECFRLKLKLDRMTPEDVADVEIKLLGGNVVMMKRTVASGGNGLILEMTARPVRFYIKHPSLGESNTVNITPEGNKVYLMDGWADRKLTVAVSCAKVGADVWMDGVYRGKTGQNMAINIPDVTAGSHTVKVQAGQDVAEEQIEVSSTNVLFNIRLQSAAHLQQFVVFKVTPEDAMVEFADEMLFVSGGMAQKLVRYGTYNYVVEAKNYYTETGTVVVGETTGKKVVEVNLRPSFGRVEVKGGSVSGAYVYIDKQRMGTAPVLSEALAPGMHNVRIVKDMYNSYEADVEVREGETVVVSPALEKNFAELTLVSREGAAIWIDGEFKGNGTWTGTLMKGLHAVECRKDGYESMTESLNVESDMDGSRIALSAMTPLYGILQVSSNPMMADVYMDGANIGQTPIYMPEALVGRHELKIRMDGYDDWTSTINITEGQLCEVNGTLAKASEPVKQSAASGSVLPTLLRSGTTGPQYGKYGRDSAECIRYLSYYTEYYKQKNYDDAIVHWRKAYRVCPPSARYSMLSDGTVMLRRQMTQNVSEAYKRQLLDSLKTLYAERIEYFPKYRKSSLNLFGLDMVNFMKGSPLKLWEILREVAGELQLDARSHIVLKYMALTGELYQSGKITRNDVQAAYDLGYKCSKETTDEKFRKDLSAFLDMLNGYLGGAAMTDNGAQSPDPKGDMYPLMSLIAQRKYVEAYGKCQELMATYPDLAGVMYLYMAAIWAEQPCQGNEIEKVAKYWVAVDFLKKARSAVGGGASVDELIKQYQANFPDAAEAFMYDINEGQSYTVSCGGLRAVTTVRTKR